MPARKPRAAAHQARKFRPVVSTAARIPIGDDTAIRQADAAAWSAISGLPMDLYRGVFTYIPLPADLQARMRAAAEELTAMPGPARAEALLRLAHVAAYGEGAAPPVFHGRAEAAPDAPRNTARGIVEMEWWDSVAPAARPEALAAFAEEAREALANLADDPANEGEAPFAPAEPATREKEWWE
jgi:hypothetical protein